MKTKKDKHYDFYNYFELFYFKNIIDDFVLNVILKSALKCFAEIFRIF